MLAGLVKRKRSSDGPHRKEERRRSRLIEGNWA
jgi:hypothetical protein